MKRIFTLAILVMAVAVIWGYTAPGRSLEQLRTAAESGDAAELTKIVDFPALRESVKTQVQAAFERRMQDPDGGPLATLAETLGEQIMEPTIDRLLTPEVIASLAAGRPPASRGSTEPRDLPAHDVDWITPDTFRLRFPGDASEDEGFWLEFRRRGITWMLVGAGLPPGSI